MAKNRKEHDKKYDKKRAGQRTRNWLAVFYPEDLPDNWQDMVDKLQFKWIESPLHNNDFNADGKPKKIHKHTLLMFGSVKTQEQVKEILIDLFGESNEGSIVGVALPIPANDRSGSVRYMAHLDNPSKAQYDINEIIGHNGADVGEILRYSATETQDMIIAMEEYIEEHGIIELSAFSKAIRYDYREWHTLLATKMTLYFTNFISSQRHSLGQNQETIVIDKETGEVKTDLHI